MKQDAVKVKAWTDERLIAICQNYVRHRDIQERAAARGNDFIQENALHALDVDVWEMWALTQN